MSIFSHHKKPTASIFTTTEGHLSIAQAVEQDLQKEFSTHFNYLRGQEFKLYTPFYTFFPHLFKIPFKLSSVPSIQKVIRSYSKISYKKLVDQAFRSQKPQTVISCFYAYNHLIHQQQKHHPFTFINIIADPRTISPIAPHPHAYNLVFDSQAVQTCLDFGIPREKIITSGWFVRQQFQQAYNQKKVRRQLKLDPNTLTLLIVAGSEGTNTILKNFPAFINSKKPVQVIFACGKNKALHSTITTLSKALKNAHPKTQANISALGFTKDIHFYLQAADLVIGKAGPNLLFESVATLTPFLATTHISGQEDGNLDIIRQYQLGYVEENITRSVKLIKDLVNHPEKLKQFHTPLKKMAKYNQKSADILRQTIKDSHAKSPTKTPNQ